MRTTSTDRRQEFSVRAPRRRAGRHSLRAAASGRVRGETPSRPGGARRGCEPAGETAPGPARAQAVPAPKAPPGPGAPAHRLHVIGKACARECGSRSHTQEGGSRPATRAKGYRAAVDPRPEGERGRPKRRDRSPVFPVLLDFPEQVAERHHRTPWRRRARRGQGRRGDPALADSLGQQGVSHKRASTGSGRHQLRNDTVAIGDQHCLAAGRKANVFAQLVFEDLQPHRPHAVKVASGSYLCQVGIR